MTARAAALVAVAVLAGGPLSCQSSSPSFPYGRVVDLTHAFGADTIYWPTEEGFVFEQGTRGPTETVLYYEAHGFRAPEHGGTHIDAPIHFFEGRRHVDEIPAAELLAEGIRVDVTVPCAADRDYQVTRADLGRWEEEHGRIPESAIVLLHTGFGALWPDRVAYLGTDERGAAAVVKLHFPGLHVDAARWLVEHRAVRAIGLDTASIDHGASSRFETHVELFRSDVPVFENVANLDQLPDRDFAVVALPMKIAGGSGAPLRIVAIVPEERAARGDADPVVSRRQRHRPFSRWHITSLRRELHVR